MNVLALLTTTAEKNVIKYVKENKAINQSHQRVLMKAIHRELLKGRDSPVK